MGLRKIGGAWKKQGKNGPFLSGEIQLEGRDGPKLRLMIFQNGKKEKPSQPDYTIHLADDQKKEQANEQRTAGDDADTSHPF
jgi:hypothetical protein